jgi:hypothetical protein
MSEAQKSASLDSFSADGSRNLAQKLSAFREQLGPEEKALLSELLLAGQGGVIGSVLNFQEAAHRALAYLAEHSVLVQARKKDGMWAQWAAANGGT